MLPLELLDRLAVPIPPPTDTTDRGPGSACFSQYAAIWCNAMVQRLPFVGF